MAYERAVEIGKLEKRLGIVAEKIDDLLKEDRLFAARLDRVIAHCTKALDRTDSRLDLDSSQCDQRERMKFDEGEATALASIDSMETTGSGEPNAVNVVSPSSSSVLQARELFPENSPDSTSPMSGQSSPSPQAHFIRNITNVRGQRVRAILLDMKERMQRRDSV